MGSAIVDYILCICFLGLVFWVVLYIMTFLYICILQSGKEEIPHFLTRFLCTESAELRSVFGLFASHSR